MVLHKCIKERSSYASIFNNEFNLSFKTPRSDTCSKCDAGGWDELHKDFYQAAFEHQKIDRAKMTEESKIAYCNGRPATNNASPAIDNIKSILFETDVVL